MPSELHRVVRPLFRLKWPPKVRLLLGLKGHGGPRVSLLFKVSTLSHRHGGQKAHWAFIHMTRPIKEHHPSPLLHIFPLFLSNVFECYKKKGGLIVCCGSQNYAAFPPLFHGKKLMNVEQKAGLLCFGFVCSIWFHSKTNLYSLRLTVLCWIINAIKFEPHQFFSIVRCLIYWFIFGITQIN